MVNSLIQDNFIAKDRQTHSVTMIMICIRTETCTFIKVMVMTTDNIEMFGELSIFVTYRYM